MGIPSILIERTNRLRWQTDANSPKLFLGLFYCPCQSIVVVLEVNMAKALLNPHKTIVERLAGYFLLETLSVC